MVLLNESLWILTGQRVRQNERQERLAEPGLNIFDPYLLGASMFM